MAEYPLSDQGPLENDGAPWVPSANLCRWLMIGAWAVVIDVCLSAASLFLAQLGNPEPKGFTISDGLDLAVVLPQILILLAFLALGREVFSIGLWRSSIGVFGAMWLMEAMFSAFFTKGEVVGLPEVLTTVAVGTGIVVLLIVVTRKPSGFLQPVPREVPSPEPGPEEAKSADSGGKPSEELQSKKAGWGCGTILFGLMAGKLLSKAIRKAGINWGPVGAIAFFLIMVSLPCLLIAFLVWFGISKIRLRHRLGPMAAVSGWADLFSVALLGAYLVLLVVAMVQGVVHQQEPDFNEPALAISGAVVEVFDLVWKALFAALFLSVRRRANCPA